MQNANNSGSANYTKSNVNAYGFGFLNWIQEFLCRPQIRIGSVPYRTVPLLRIQLGCNTSYVRVPNI
jgi:hypothetical protein